MYPRRDATVAAAISSSAAELKQSEDDVVQDDCSPLRKDVLDNGGRGGLGGPWARARALSTTAAAVPRHTAHQGTAAADSQFGTARWMQGASC